MTARRIVAIPIKFALVCAVMAATTAHTAAPNAWELWSSGQTRLRGANIYQRRVYPELDGTEFMGPGPFGPPYTQEDFNRLAASGANLVNVSHPGIFTEKPPYVLDAQALSNLRKLVDMARAAGLYVVISFRTGPGRSEFTFFLDEVGEWFDESYLNDQVWKDQEAQQAWVDMWTETAKRFKGDPNVVAYDLMVEPNSNDAWLDIWDPDEFYQAYGGSSYDWNQLYPRIAAGIRSVDQETPIMVQGMAYSSPWWFAYIQPVSLPKVLYSVHEYEPVTYTHQEPSENRPYPGNWDVDEDGVPDSFNSGWLDELFGEIDSVREEGRVVAANEFGCVRWAPGAGDFLSDVIDRFEARGMGWAVWMWYPEWEPLYEGDNAFDYRMGADPDNTDPDYHAPLVQLLEGYWARNTDRPQGLQQAKSYWVPAAAHVAGAMGTNWRTDLFILAQESSDASVRLEYYRTGTANTDPCWVTYSIGAGEALSLGDVLYSEFGESGTGALRVEVLSGDVYVASRTYNATENGTYGQYVPASEGECSSSGCVIPMVKHNAGYRSNFGFVDAGGSGASLTLRVFDCGGELVFSQDVVLEPGEHMQLNSPLGGYSLDCGYARVEVAGGGPVFSYLSVVDNRTGDAVYIPAEESRKDHFSKKQKPDNHFTGN